MSYIRVYLGRDLKEQFELGADRVTIGRSESNRIVLADEGVSREHAAIEIHDEDYFVQDLGSQNGVFLNREKVERAKLKYWDEIQIHNFVIKFMAKPGLGVSKDDRENHQGEKVDEDKTKFFNITDEKQLDDLRAKTKECFLTYQDSSGKSKKVLIKKPRVVFGKSQSADIELRGWFAPTISATLEKQGGVYELVPVKRGKVFYQNKPVTRPTTMHDGAEFSVRGRTFRFYNRLTKTS